MKYFKDLQSIKNQMNELVCVYDDLQDRLYEIDRSWQNNLVFHGIKPDAGGVYESTDCLEAKIKGVLRTNLNIGREIPIVRLQRIFNGSDVRGYKPVIVNFQVSFRQLYNYIYFRRKPQNCIVLKQEKGLSSHVQNLFQGLQGKKPCLTRS